MPTITEVKLHTITLVIMFGYPPKASETHRGYKKLNTRYIGPYKIL